MKAKRRDSDKENEMGPEAESTDVLGEQEDKDVIF